jgi:Uma2 family endonuclease
MLRHYRDRHPKAKTLDATLGERIVETGDNRRRVDRLIWAGLGRVPRRGEAPTIVADFVSRRKRERVRDYETKRDEFLAINVKEYWLLDRFQRIMTVFTPRTGKVHRRVIREHQVYRTTLLPGFELPLDQLLAQADRWSSLEADEK